MKHQRPAPPMLPKEKGTDLSDWRAELCSRPREPRRGASRTVGDQVARFIQSGWFFKATNVRPSFQEETVPDRYDHLITKYGG